MHKQYLFKTSLRFRRWSRKAYATFASIGRCVTIGCLRKDAADSSLAKQKNGTSASCEPTFWGPSLANDKEVGISSSPDNECNILFLLEQLDFRRIYSTLLATNCSSPQNRSSEFDISLTTNSYLAHKTRTPMNIHWAYKSFMRLFYISPILIRIFP